MEGLLRTVESHSQTRFLGTYPPPAWYEHQGAGNLLHQPELWRGLVSMGVALVVTYLLLGRFWRSGGKAPLNRWRLQLVHSSSAAQASGALADLQKALAEETSKQSASMQAQQKLEAQLRDQLLKNMHFATKLDDAVKHNEAALQKLELMGEDSVTMKLRCSDLEAMRDEAVHSKAKAEIAHAEELNQLKASHAEYRKRCAADSTAMLERHSKDVAEVSQRLFAQKDAHWLCKEELCRLSKEREEVVQQLEDANAARTTLEQTLEDYKQREDEQNAQAEALRAELHTARTQAGTMQQDHTAQLQAMVERRVEVETLRAELAEANTQMSAMQQDHTNQLQSAAETSAGEQKAVVDALKTELSEALTQIGTIQLNHTAQLQAMVEKAEVEALRAELAEANIQIRAMEQTHTTRLQSVAQKSESEKNEKHAQEAALRSELEQALTQIAALKLDHSALRSRMQDAAAKSEVEHKAEVEAMKALLDKQVAAMKQEHTNERCNWNTTVEEMYARVSKLIADAEEAARQCEAEVATRRACEGKLTNLDAQADEHMRRLDEAHSARVKLEGLLEGANARVSTLEGMLEASQQAAAHLEMQLSKVNQKSGEMVEKSELDKAHQQLADLQSTLTAQRRSWNTTVEEMSTRITSMSEQQHKAQRENRHLLGELAKLKRANADLEASTTLLQLQSSLHSSKATSRNHSYCSSLQDMTEAWGPKSVELFSPQADTAGDMGCSPAQASRKLHFEEIKGNSEAGILQGEVVGINDELQKQSKAVNGLTQERSVLERELDEAHRQIGAMKNEHAAQMQNMVDKCEVDALNAELEAVRTQLRVMEKEHASQMENVVAVTEAEWAWATMQQSHEALRAERNTLQEALAAAKQHAEAKQKEALAVAVSSDSLDAAAMPWADTNAQMDQSPNQLPHDGANDQSVVRVQLLDTSEPEGVTFKFTVEPDPPCTPRLPSSPASLVNSPSKTPASPGNSPSKIFNGVTPFRMMAEAAIQGVETLEAKTASRPAFMLDREQVVRWWNRAADRYMPAEQIVGKDFRTICWNTVRQAHKFDLAVEQAFGGEACIVAQSVKCNTSSVPTVWTITLSRVEGVVASSGDMDFILGKVQKSTALSKSKAPRPRRLLKDDETDIALKPYIERFSGICIAKVEKNIYMIGSRRRELVCHKSGKLYVKGGGGVVPLDEYLPRANTDVTKAERSPTRTPKSSHDGRRVGGSSVASSSRRTSFDSAVDNASVFSDKEMQLLCNKHPDIIVETTE